MFEATSEGAALVGRTDELRQLDEICAAVAGGWGRLVTVRGAAGIGKTRFCEEISARARAAGFALAWGRCWPEGGAPPLWPWHPALTELCGREAAELLDADSGSSSVDPQRFDRFTAVAARIAHASRSRPVCLVIDDAHAADPGALLLARFVSRAVRHLPTLIIVARRVEATTLDPTVREVLDTLDSEGLPLVLHHFDVEETATFLATRGMRALEPALVATIQRITGGNPLFLQRLASLDHLGHPGAHPGGLRRAITEAARQLDPTDWRILCTGAVLGRVVSVAEAAALAEVEPATVLGAVEAGSQAGLVSRSGPGTFELSHDVVQEVLVASLSPAVRLDAHAHASRIVGGPVEGSSASRAARRAHHAVRAAPRSRVDAEWAVAASREAARSMNRNFAYEQASSLLADAARIHEEAGLSHPARLLVEWAQAVLSTGELARARALFDAAALAAEEEGDPLLVAEAAIGLGGLWVDEQRTPIDWERARALQLRALADLPPGEEVLRCRLETRLAAEVAHLDGSLDAVRGSLARARDVGDDRALGEALSLCHHVLLRPEHTAERLTLADELISVASRAGDGVLALMGLCWRTVDLFHLGSPDAPRALADLRTRTDATGSGSLRYITRVLGVMSLLREGQLDAAEAQAEACFALGTEVGDADAVGYLGAHLVVIRLLQGRHAEALSLVEEVLGSPTLVPAEFTFHATGAMLAARLGQLDRARATLDQLTSEGLQLLPRSSTWLSGMCSIIEGAHLVGDASAAAEAAGLIAPFADLPVMPSLAVVCLGSVERYLGLAAQTTADTPAAIHHLERAVEANVALGNRPFAAMSRADLAIALAARRASGDHDRAPALLEEATAAGDEIGMAPWADQWRERLAHLAGDEGTEAEPAPRAGVFRRQGQRWHVALDGRRVVVDDLVGMRHLAQLLAHPGAEVPATLLAGGGTSVPSPPRQEVLDDAARAAYARRAEALVDELRDARRRGDDGRARSLEQEMEALADQLDAASGIGGRRRSFAGPDERARTAVRKAIKRAIDEIGAADPEIGDALRDAVTTGTRCSYDPDAVGPVAWAT